MEPKKSKIINQEAAEKGKNPHLCDVKLRTENRLEVDQKFPLSLMHKKLSRVLLLQLGIQRHLSFLSSAFLRIFWDLKRHGKSIWVSSPILFQSKFTHEWLSILENVEWWTLWCISSWLCSNHNIWNYMKTHWEIPEHPKKKSNLRHLVSIHHVFRCVKIQAVGQLAYRWRGKRNTKRIQKKF